MGYDLHITRSTDWTSNLGVEIRADEWLTLVAEDPDLTVDPQYGPHSAKSMAGAWFAWFEGNVFTSDPDRPTVAKMLDLATRLSAVVQGDDGEFYESAQQWPSTRPSSATGSPL